MRVVFLQQGEIELRALYGDVSINWQKLKELCTYHRIRPVVAEAARLLDFQHPLIQRYAVFAREQSLLNLLCLKELETVLSAMKEQGIPAVPYKGMVFLQKLYDGKSLRESGDLDIVVDKTQGVATMLLLQKLGYTLKLSLPETEETFGKLVADAQGRQATWCKQLPSGNSLHIDLHWGVNEEYHSYTIGTEDFFKGASLGVLTRTEVLLPSEAALFAMIINHNGGRECWTRLKDVVDLLVFTNKHPEFDGAEATKGYRMQKIFLQGKSLLDAFLKREKVPTALDQTFARYWDEGSREWVLPKLRFVWLYKSMQDSPVSTREIIQHFLAHFTSKYFKTDIYGYPFEGKYKVVNTLTQGLRKRYARP